MKLPWPLTAAQDSKNFVVRRVAAEVGSLLKVFSRSNKLHLFKLECRPEPGDIVNRPASSLKKITNFWDLLDRPKCPIQDRNLPRVVEKKSMGKRISFSEVFYWRWYLSFHLGEVLAPKPFTFRHPHSSLAALVTQYLNSIAVGARLLCETITKKWKHSK